MDMKCHNQNVTEVKITTEPANAVNIQRMPLGVAPQAGDSHETERRVCDVGLDQKHENM